MAPKSKRQRKIELILPKLPNEVWSKIFSHLSKESKKNVTATCKLWFDIIRRSPKLSPRHILVSLSEIQNSTWNWENWHSTWNWQNWPGLKIIEFHNDIPFQSAEKAIDFLRKINFKQCPAIEKVILCVDDLAVKINPIRNNGGCITPRILKNGMRIGKLVLNPKSLCL